MSEQKLRHVFTAAEGMKGTRRSQLNRKAELRLLKQQLKQMSHHDWMELAKILLANPAIDGTIAFFIVQAAKIFVSKRGPGNVIGQPEPTDPFSLFNSANAGSIFKGTPIQGFIDLLTTTVIPNSLIETGMLDGLQLACIAYVGSGGNITGAAGTIASLVGGMVNAK
jgi:hypothetical protein